MNDYYNYSHVDIETPDERQRKIQKQTRLFSRVFLALFVYTVISQFMATAIYTAASVILTTEQYLAFAQNYVITIIISSAVQYLIAFPVLLLMLVGADKAHQREKSKLSLKDFVLIVCIGQALMYIGNLISNVISTRFQLITGKLPENSVDTIVSEVPLYLIFIVVVILAPIVEELIFRKLMIDRLSIYGDKMAIIFTAVAFGLIHANLYQLFYATLLGFVLGYVYTKTRKVKYTIFIHMIINFLGSIAVMPVQKAAEKLDVIMETLMQLGESATFENFDFVGLLINAVIVFLFANLQYSMIIGGCFALWYYFKNRKISVSKEKEIYIPDREIAKNGVVNVGSILFIAVSVILTLINLILS